jgi:hypothetical protein
MKLIKTCGPKNILAKKRRSMHNVAVQIGLPTKSAEFIWKIQKYLWRF